MHNSIFRIPPIRCCALTVSDHGFTSPSRWHPARIIGGLPCARTPNKNARLQVFQYEIKRFLDETTHTPACRSPGARGQGLRAKGQGAKGQGCQVPCFSSISQSASLSPNVKYPQLQSEHTPGSCSYVVFLPSPNRRAFCPLIRAPNFKANSRSETVRGFLFFLVVQVHSPTRRAFCPPN